MNNITKNIDIPDNIVDDISNTGYVITKIHKHGKLYILSLKQNIPLNWSPKDFSRFDWVVNNNEFNNNLKEFKLKIKV